MSEWTLVLNAATPSSTPYQGTYPMTHTWLRDGESVVTDHTTATMTAGDTLAVHFTLGGSLSTHEEPTITLTIAATRSVPFPTTLNHVDVNGDWPGDFPVTWPAYPLRSTESTICEFRVSIKYISRSGASTSVDLTFDDPDPKMIVNPGG